ncbi:hypothetical protein ACFST9_10710 [Hymenobacter monticola]|uniref:HEPN domain-containing protein n=1 Tax=Hymenobacter monticola TaxID=1705399 RepID=A0ABY4B8Y2_9BACT|nr:hypothetical protein [Hymenobacter monticola]UOE35334.1 hypothetical protein MTP16_06700 [Hymenobacter monticola]
MEPLADLQHQFDEDKELLNYESTKMPTIRHDFFPNGRKEYAQTTLLTAELLLARAAKAATHAKTLGADFGTTRHTGFRDAFRDGTG